MLGIDIDDNKIRVVNLRRRSGGFLLAGVMELPLEPEQGSDARQVGEVLGQGLLKRGWSSQRAVMTLSRRAGFVRRFSAGLPGWQGGKLEGGLSRGAIDSLLQTAKQTLMVPAEEMVFDLWSGSELPNGETGEMGVLVAAAQKSAVEFCQEAAEVAEVKLLSLEMRSVAAINGLHFHWRQSVQEHIAVVYLDGREAEVALMDAEGLVSLQSFRIDEGHDDSEGNGAGLLRQLVRVFNTLRLSEGNGVPERLYLAGPGMSASAQEIKILAGNLQEALGIEVTVCQGQEGLTLEESLGEELSAYIPCLGAALDGLKVSATWFDFLHPRGRVAETNKRFSWKPLLVLVAGVILIGVAFWLSLLQQKLQVLHDREGQLEALTPNMERMLNAQKIWELFRPYLPVNPELPATVSGSRVEYLRILGEITRLFPEMDNAYITDITIAGVMTSMLESNVSIRGKGVDREKLITFIERMRESEMFREAKQRGSMVQDASDPCYPVSFSVTCNLRRAVGGAKP